MLTVLLGGARAGKTSMALRLAERSPSDVTYIATSPRGVDAELDGRIERHRAERPAPWSTIEAELDLAAAITGADDAATVIVDCLTVWVNNLFHDGDDAATIEGRSRAAIDAAAVRSGDTIVVSNEVGLGIVPVNQLARSYRDVLGRVNQEWVAAADRAWFLIAGRALRLEPLDRVVM